MSPPDSIKLLRSDLISQAKTLTAIVEDQRDMKAVLAQMEIDKAVRAERDKALNDRLDRIEKSIEGIYRLGWWILAAFGTSAIALVANFLFKGGFNVS